MENDSTLSVYVCGKKMKIRNERRKWIHQFENVSAVVFVASLSSFDEPMFDDETINSLQDSIELFEDICNTHYFVHQHMILVLNKQDLLQEKINAETKTQQMQLTLNVRRFDMTCVNNTGKKLQDYPATSDYAGAEKDLEASVKFIESKFRDAFERSIEKLKTSPQQATVTAAQHRLLFVRVTCAYQADNVKTIFSDVQGILTGKITKNEN
ncbi:hypothetical protein RFI_16282 [Reticulomyxa filosa]|uniref:Uncharacterized protein n=1 Tax=Reticulomyxa filosa TaxID=46433 RepID=X6N6K5_RETFI|nr:hypothetical protein RFI_16282 [Reticulomyxa filosa]|eukprot:ETO20922.1 hypothetical protein RFI_16282 [Reticulomyxa filosa]